MLIVARRIVIGINSRRAGAAAIFPFKGGRRVCTPFRPTAAEGSPQPWPKPLQSRLFCARAPQSSGFHRDLYRQHHHAVSNGSAGWSASSKINNLAFLATHQNAPSGIKIGITRCRPPRPFWAPILLPSLPSPHRLVQKVARANRPSVADTRPTSPSQRPREASLGS